MFKFLQSLRCIPFSKDKVRFGGISAPHLRALAQFVAILQNFDVSGRN